MSAAVISNPRGLTVHAHRTADRYYPARHVIGHHTCVAVLLHFVAKWPHRSANRSEVEDAARSLGAEVVEVDVDADPDKVKAYNVLNVPAVAVQSAPNNQAVGAFPSEKLIERLRPHVR